MVKIKKDSFFLRRYVIFSFFLFSVTAFNSGMQQQTKAIGISLSEEEKFVREKVHAIIEHHGTCFMPFKYKCQDSSYKLTLQQRSLLITMQIMNEQGNILHQVLFKEYINSDAFKKYTNARVKKEFLDLESDQSSEKFKQWKQSLFDRGTPPDYECFQFPNSY